MRVVVTGSTGRLGREVVAAARAAGHDVIGLARRAMRPCDLTEPDEVRRRIAEAAPDLVVHTAGATDVDACEDHPVEARRLNVDATRHVADATAAVGAHLVHVSTNFVFDGTTDMPYREDDAPAPISVYGSTKLAAEEAAGEGATVVRTAWLWSPEAGGIVPAIVAAAGRPGTLRFTPDEVAQPTAATDLAPLLLRLGGARRPGCFHAAGDGSTSSFDLARWILSELGDDPGRVVPIGVSEVPGRRAPRPRDGRLDTRRLREAGESLPHHRDAVRAFLGTA